MENNTKLSKVLFLKTVQKPVHIWEKIGVGCFSLCPQELATCKQREKTTI